MLRAQLWLFIERGNQWVRNARVEVQTYVPERSNRLTLWALLYIRLSTLQWLSKTDAHQVMNWRKIKQKIKRIKYKHMFRKEATWEKSYCCQSWIWAACPRHRGCSSRRRSRARWSLCTEIEPSFQVWYYIQLCYMFTVMPYRKHWNLHNTGHTGLCMK